MAITPILVSPSYQEHFPDEYYVTINGYGYVLGVDRRQIGLLKLLILLDIWHPKPVFSP